MKEPQVPVSAITPKESLAIARKARVAWFAAQRERSAPADGGEVVPLFGEAVPQVSIDDDPRFVLVRESMEAMSDRGRDDVARYVNNRLSRDR
jgi:hypothetical protein